MISRIFCLLVFTNFKMGSLSKIKWHSGKIEGSKRGVPRHDCQSAGVIPNRGATERDGPDLPHPPVFPQPTQGWHHQSCDTPLPQGVQLDPTE